MDWFLLNSGQVEGPFKAEHLKEKIESGSLESSTLVCRQGDPNWRALNELKEQILAEAKPDESLKVWILLTENLELALSQEQEGQYVQSGPYTTSEVLELLNSGQAKYSDYIWKSGFEKWIRINEVDEFFKVSQGSDTPQMEPTPEPVATAAEEKPESLLNQILEQTRLTNYDFIEEEKPPVEAQPLDESAFKPIEIPPVESPAEQPQFVLTQPSAEAGEWREPLETVEGKKTKQSPFYEKAAGYFPWLMTALAGILVLMVGVWALSLNKESVRENAQVPTHPQDVKEKSVPVPITEPTEGPKAESRIHPASPTAAVRTVVPRSVHEKTRKPLKDMVNNDQPATVNLSLIASKLLKNAESLDRQYNSLKDKPLHWRRFYQAWQRDFKNIEITAQNRKSKIIRQLLIGRNRLNDRARMMDSSVTDSSPVSSDFEQEDLPGLFRTLRGQIQRQ